MKNTFLKATKGNLVVSCQALPGEPLHSSFIMARMARAAKEAGASAIRANSVVDIQAIQDTKHICRWLDSLKWTMTIHQFTLRQQWKKCGRSQVLAVK